MKAWAVGSPYAGYVYVRAETRGKARTLWPEYSRYDPDSFTGTRVVRKPELDGDGPARELRYVGKPGNCTEDQREWCPCLECEIADIPAMIEANR